MTTSIGRSRAIAAEATLVVGADGTAEVLYMNQATAKSYVGNAITTFGTRHRAATIALAFGHGVGRVGRRLRDPPGGGAGSSLGGSGRFGPARDPYVAVAAHHLGGHR